MADKYNKIFSIVKNSDLFFPVIILMIGVITFVTNDIIVSSDLAWHMNVALDMYNGVFFKISDLAPVFNKGPLWPFMICISYYIFGVSPWSAFIVVRIFAILNPLAIYFLGKELFNPRIGFIASILILSSYSMNYWSYRHLDAVWAFFCVLSVFVSIKAFRKESCWLFLLSGAIVGCSYLVKQSSLLFFPVVIFLIMFIKSFRTIKNFYGILLHLFLIILLISPWLCYAYLQTHNSSIALLGSGSKQQIVDNLKFISIVKTFFMGLGNYYVGGSNSVSYNFMIAPLFIISWGFTVFKAFKGDKPSIILVCILFLLLPYISIVGFKDLRVGQLIVFLMFTYLVVAMFIFDIGHFLASKVQNQNAQLSIKFAKYLTLLLIILLLTSQTVFRSGRDKGNVHFLQNSFFFQRFYCLNKERRVNGIINRGNIDLSKWIGNSILKKDPILFLWKPEARAVYFNTKGDYDILNVPLNQFLLHTANYKDRNNTRISHKITKAINDVLLISSKGGSPNPRNSMLWSLNERDMIDMINGSNIKYVIVGEIFNFLSAYFDSNQSFSIVASLQNGRYKIYKIKEFVHPSDHPVYITKRTIKWLNILKTVDKGKFNDVKEKLFVEKLLIPGYLVDKIADRDLPDMFVQTTLVHKNK